MESCENEVFSLLSINENPKLPKDVKNMTKLSFKETEFLTERIDFWIENKEQN